MDDLKNSVLMALEWLSGPGMVKDNKPVGKVGEAMGYSCWNGAIRGEYLSSEKEWESFCPIWHTGQAVKAFVMAADAFEMPELLEDAVKAADFILAQQLKTGVDSGLILAYEVMAGKVNTSAVLESLDGLFMLTDASGVKKYEECAVRALEWTARRTWMPELSKFRDIYSPSEGRFLEKDADSQNRPLLDDAVFWKGWKRSGNENFKKIALATAETLLKDEEPAGNWIKYIPCRTARTLIHPRHAFWWGKPMLTLYQETKDERFLQVFKRAVDWYRQALRIDGGLFRDTKADFSTSSFGHAASGSACAAIMFEKLYSIDRDETLLPLIDKAENFCMAMQLTHPEEPSLKGAVLEKVCFPTGSDTIPFLVRDLGSIFFIQAASLTWKRVKKGESEK